jgi:iron complex outermembrane recepter protein
MICASAFALTPTAAALAADVPAAPATTSSQVADVVVTVNKRPQLLQSVPATATAVTSTTLNQAGVIDMRGISTLVPSLSIIQTVGPVNQSYRIRGMGSDPNIPTFEPDVALFVDGVYMPRSGLGVDDLTDVARVEVLEGPQSTLYGKNATAGVINVVTKAPSHTFQGHIEASYSDLDSSLQASVFRVAASVSGPINDSIRFRLGGVTYNQGDSYKNLEPGAPNANNLNRFSARGEVDIDLAANTDIDISYAHSEIYNTRAGDADNLYYTFPPAANNAFRLDTLLGPHFGIPLCPDNNPNDRVICTTSPWQNSAQSDIASATLNSKVGDNTLTAITAFSDYAVRDQNALDVAQVLLPIVTFDDHQRGSVFSQEVRLASPTGGKLEWIAGGYYEHSNFLRGGGAPTFVLGAAAPFVPLPAPLSAFKVGQPGDEGFLDSKEADDYGALFGQLTYHFNDRFTLIGGLRDQIDAKRASIENSYVNSPATPILTQACGPLPINLLTVSLTPTVTASCPRAAVNGVFSHQTNYVSWNVTGQFQATAKTMAYLTVSQGGKAFGYNIGYGSTPASQREFTNETVTNYEVGLKSTLLDGRAQFSLAAFYTEERDYQNAGFVGLQFQVDNAQLVTIKGFEANGAFVLGHGFTADGGLTYVDAVYNKYTNGSCYFGKTANNGHGGCNLSGMGLPQTPQWRVHASLQYTHPTPMGQLYGRADWTWQSSMLADTNLDPRSLQPAYSLVNLRLGVRFDDGLDVSLWGNNVFNTTYSQADYVSNLFGANDPAFQRYLGRPAEYGVTVKKNF